MSTAKTPPVAGAAGGEAISVVLMMQSFTLTSHGAIRTTTYIGPPCERTSAISDAGRSSYASDPYLAEWWVRSEALRLDGCVQIVQALAARGSLRPGLSVEEAADVLATTLSPQSFLAFTVDRGWTVDHLGAWLKDALPRLLVERRDARWTLLVDRG